MTTEKQRNLTDDHWMNLVAAVVQQAVDDRDLRWFRQKRASFWLSLLTNTNISEEDIRDRARQKIKAERAAERDHS